MTSTPEPSGGKHPRSGEGELPSQAPLEPRVAELEEQVQRWRQAAVKTWSKSVAAGHNEAAAAAEATRQMDELTAKLKELQAANGRLRAQVRELQRRQFVRRAARALARRVR